MTSVDIVIPVYNEEKDLAPSVAKLREYLQTTGFPYDWTIVIADNASTDSTLEIAGHLAAKFPDVRYAHLDQKGRGRALRHVWLTGSADIVCYMDVDLSTDLSALRPMIDALASGYDVATGSRLMKGAQITRSVRREIISRIYNLMVKALFFTRFSDAQCGFKGLTRRAVRELIPLVQDQTWFFDSELLILAEKKGYRIFEVPIKWDDDPDSRVKIVRTAVDDIRGLLRVRFSRIP
ncbi:MAG: glycosyltransferase family 2 protein [Chloroflexi bacterium]|nr:glycosyltransferase family 2 protein [Chloroflexota bacterium]